MTELVMCPRCGDALDIPLELLGKPVRCASCRTVFTPTPADTIPTAPRATRVRPGPDPLRRSAFAADPPAPKSNLWVWLVAVGLAGVFGFLVLICTGVLRHMLNPEMTVHTSEEGRFKVALPGAPSPVSRTDEKGRPVVGLEATRPENQETYQVLSVEVPKELKGMKGEALLEELAKQKLPGLATGAEVSRELSTHGNLALLDVKIQQGGGLMKRVAIVRFVATADRVYALIVAGANLEPNVWYVRRFFTSFEPLGK